MLVIVKINIITQTTAIDNVLCLLGNICFKRLKIKFITTTTEFVSNMIFQIQPAIVCWSVIRSQTEIDHI